ncbi:hypothetical protein I4J48_22310 [Pseudonocardia sp. KRD-169]|uniref:HTH-type transcriptional repressor Sco4008 C-terminal domain-containing protein n=1 Tax=Pseudonocardia abyssalis TaxID=2792008 RepID=A0ABS6USB5_9PSEU|nr:hypothetical protein [Pseudonocardia abyssalis]MBW0135160.1 hypothetical protein [Pseudonocardia abyssalis]
MRITAAQGTGVLVDEVEPADLWAMPIAVAGTWAQGGIVHTASRGDDAAEHERHRTAPAPSVRRAFCRRGPPRPIAVSSRDVGCTDAHLCSGRGVAGGRGGGGTAVLRRREHARPRPRSHRPRRGRVVGAVARPRGRPRPDRRTLPRPPPRRLPARHLR